MIDGSRQWSDMKVKMSRLVAHWRGRWTRLMGCCLAEKEGTRRSSEERLQFMCGGVECSSPGPGHILILAPASRRSGLFRLVHCIIGRGGTDNVFTFLPPDDWACFPGGKTQTMLQWSRKIKLQRAQAFRAGAQHDRVMFFSKFPISRGDWNQGSRAG